MTLPKTETKESQYQSWEGEVAIEGYNDREFQGVTSRSYITHVDGEVLWININKNKCKDTLEKGNVYNVKITRKVGTKGWYLVEAIYVTGDAEVAGDTETSSVSGSKTNKEQGQSQGNYRTGLMAFICTYYQLKGEFPDEDTLINFNYLVKVGFDNFFDVTIPYVPVGATPAVADDSVDTTPAVAPTVATVSPPAVATVPVAVATAPAPAQTVALAKAKTLKSAPKSAQKLIK